MTNNENILINSFLSTKKSHFLIFDLDQFISAQFSFCFTENSGEKDIKLVQLNCERFGFFFFF